MSLKPLDYFLNYKKQLSSGVIDDEAVAYLKKHTSNYITLDINKIYYIDFYSPYKIDIFSFIETKNSYFILDKEETIEFNKKIFKKELLNQFKSNATIIKSLLKYIDIKSEINSFIDVISFFNDNNQAFKNNDVLSLVKNNDSLNDLFDDMQKVVINYKADQLTRQLFSKKYRHLITPAVKVYFVDLFQNGADKQYIKDNIMSKIARFQSADELQNFLFETLRTINQWDLAYYKQKCHLMGIEYITQDNKLLAFIKNYEEIKLLGSSNWCIQYSRSFFDNYVNSNEGREQYILFDFNQESMHSLSMIGFTANQYQNYIMYAFDKRDRSILKVFSLPDELYKFVYRLDDEQAYYIFKDRYLKQGYFITFFKQLMITNNKYYEETKKYYFKYITENNISVDVIKSHFLMLLFNNSQKQNLIDFFIDLNFYMKEREKEIWLTPIQFIHLLNQIKDNEVTDYLVNNMAHSFINKNQIPIDYKEDLISEVLKINNLSINSHLFIFSLLKEEIKDFNKILNSKKMKIQFTLGVRQNPKLKIVLNQFFGFDIF